MLRVCQEPVIAIAPDGTPTPGTLVVVAVPDGFQAALYCNDSLYSTIHKNRTNWNRPFWDEDDAAFLQFVRSVYKTNLRGMSIDFDFVRAGVKAAASRPVSDELIEHAAHVLLTDSAPTDGWAN
jgi:hypothetical protein